MSYTSLDIQINDFGFRGRINSCLQEEARVNPELKDTAAAEQIRTGVFNSQQISWDVCVATEAAYEYALNADVENPGTDPTVITDADILSAVQANWPPDPE